MKTVDRRKPQAHEHDQIAKLGKTYAIQGMRRSFRMLLLVFNKQGLPCVLVQKRVDGRLVLPEGKCEAHENTKDAVARYIIVGIVIMFRG